MDRRTRKLFFLDSLYWFAGRAAVLFFVLSVLLLALYLLGNFQEFLDSTQLLLLALLRLALLAEILLALLYAPLSIALGRPRAARLLICLLSAAFSLGLLLATGFLAAWFQI